MLVSELFLSKDICHVCGQTPCNCTHVAESQLNEFAPGSGDDGEPNEEILRKLAAQWWNGTEQQMAQAQRTLETMGWEIGPDESGDDNAGVFLIRPGDEDGHSYISFNHSDLSLDEAVAEGSEEVDTHGRTKAEWVKAVHAKYPMARVIHNKDNTQVMAVLPNGKEIRWIKDEGIIEQGVAESTEQNPYQDGYQAWSDYLSGRGSKTHPVCPYKAGHGMHAWEQGAEAAYYELARDSNEINRHDEEPSNMWEGVAEGDLNEFAPGGDSASSYYAVTANFVNEFAQQKQEELQDLIDAGWTKQDLAQAGTLKGQAADIAHFERVRDRFLKGLKPGFDAYLRGDTQMKDQLGAYWLDNDLPLNQDWEKIYGEPWGDEGVAEGIFGSKKPQEEYDIYLKGRYDPHAVKKYLLSKFGSKGWRVFAANDGSGTVSVHVDTSLYPSEIEAKVDLQQNTKPQGMAEGDKKPEPPEADYGAEYQDMVARVKKLAGLGPMKTVYDPKKRVYRNMPTAVQPKK